MQGDKPKVEKDLIDGWVVSWWYLAVPIEVRVPFGNGRIAWELALTEANHIALLHKMQEVNYGG